MRINRWRSAAVAAVVSALIGASVVGVGAPAIAASIDQPGLPALETAFDIDGDKAGTADWDGVLSNPYGPYITASGNPSTGIIAAQTGAEECGGSDGSMFPPSQEINFPSWTIGAGNVNKKADLCASGVAWEIVQVAGQQHIILYQYWSRSPDGTGDLTIYQTLEGPLPGRGDDYLIQFDYDSSGGNIKINALRWNGSRWTPTTAGVYYDAAYGRVAAVDRAGTFGEMAIDLTASGLLPQDACVSYATGGVITRTGNSDTAVLQDWFAGTPIPLNTCASVAVAKEGPASIADRDFTYVVDQKDRLTVHDGSLSGPVADSDASPNSITAAIRPGQSHTWKNVIAEPDYRVSEVVDSLPPGVTLDTIVCTYTDLYQADRTPRTVTLYENGADTGATFPIFPSAVPDVPTPSCVITNTATSLTLNKELVNDHGGTATLADVTLTATSGSTTVIDGQDPAAGPEGLTALVAPGAYTLSEAAPAGYAASAWVCEGAALEGDVVTITAGQNAVCTIRNDDIPATLTLTKTVTNTWGGSLTAGDFTLTATHADADVTASGVSGAATVTNADVPVGSYVISEQPRPGYELVGVSCSGGTSFDQATRTLVVAAGQHATCELTNRDLPGRLTLVKKVTTDHGGTATPADWTLSAAGPTPVTGTTGTETVTGVSVIAGEYALSESGGPAGYAAGAWQCTGGTVTASTVSVAGGADVVCTIVNDDEPATLTLVKEVVNDDGGGAETTDWTLSAAGPETASGVTGAPAVTAAPVSAGTYTLSEAGGPAGYAAGAWACDGGTLSGDRLSLANGEDATCTIVNDDRPGTLTLIKKVENNAGGTATARDFSLHATGVAGSHTVVGGQNPPVALSVPAGDYVLSESGGPSGYAATGWACSGGELTGSTVTVANGAAVTCTITNVDKPALLTLVKQVVNDDGGEASATDWLLTADGPGTLSGHSGEDTVTGVAVPAGDYILAESGPSGYAAGDWSCVGAEIDGAVVTLGVGVEATCTIINDDVAPRLTLVKEVVNDDGGTAADTAWTLSATSDATSISGATRAESVTGVSVPAGTYVLAEAGGPRGYTAGAWACTGAAVQLAGASVTLAPGEDVTCTIVNDDVAPTLTLVKEVVNDDGGTADATDWTLTAAGPATVSGVTGSSTVTAMPVAAGTYALTESGGPRGYSAGAWSCTGGAPVTGPNVTLLPGDQATCTIVNDDIAPWLTLVKEVVNDDGGSASATDWTLTATGAEGAIAGTTGATTVTAAPVRAGEYALTESGGPTGYAAGTWSCDTGASEMLGASITLAPGDEVTCTIVNDDIAPILTLVKDVVNDDGGSAEAEDWTLTATGPSTISGATGTAEVTSAAVSAGAYTLTESAGPAGYRAGDWSCQGTEASGGGIVLVPGDEVTCTIVNDDIAPILTLVKEVVNDDGGTADATEWTLTATGPSAVSGATGTLAVTATAVTAGAYTLSETGGPAGYAAGEWTCDLGHSEASGAALTLAVGDTAVCTVVNDDIAPRLTLMKVLVNDDGGSSSVEDWTLTATGPVTVSGRTGDGAITDAAVPAGDYALSESGGPAGYVGSSWVCGGAETDGASVTLAPGDEATCVITNDDTAPTLTLIKEVVNDDGGAASATDWTLSATGPVTLSGVTGDSAITAAKVRVGAYALAESGGPAGYAAADWRCTGAELVDGEVLLAPGLEATCIIVNDDIAPRLTLVKQVVNDDGGRADAADWTLSATGVDRVSGTTGSSDVTDVAVSAGVYALAETGGPAGYAAGAWTCEGADAGASSVELAPGDVVVCTIVNDDIAPTLTLVKEVVNDDGGAAAATDWTLSATPVGAPSDGPVASSAHARTAVGSDPVSGATGSEAVTGVSVAAGEYSLAESGGPGGYAPSAWSCVGGALDGASPVLAPGDEATCTIVNDDVAPTLTLIKNVANDDGGVAAAEDWTLVATGPAPISGATGSGAVTAVPVDAGTYALSETGGPAGYTAGDWTCDAIDVTAGQIRLPLDVDVTCTVVNDDVPVPPDSPVLTLVKEVVNDDGGSAAPADFTLRADGPVNVSGAVGSSAVTSVTVPAGEYALSESGPDGYASRGWVCEGAEATDTTVSLVDGARVTCTVTNDDIAPKPATLTLVKKVVNDDGGSAQATDWTLSATGEATVRGVTGSGDITGRSIPAGEYLLAEGDGPGGYTAGAWTCDGATVADDAVTLSPGATVTCTIVNDDDAVDLAVTKDDGGASVKPGDELDYTITVRNVGTRDVDADEPVTVTDHLPEHVTFVSGPAGCAADGRTVVCDVDPALLPAGGETVIVLTVAFADDTPAGEVVNMAVVDTTDDPAPEEPVCPSGVERRSSADNVDCEQTPVATSPELTVTKTALEESAGEWIPSDGRASFGDRIRYVITVAAGGTGVQHDVRVSDVLDERLAYAVDATTCVASRWCSAAFDPTTRTVTADLGDLVPGDEARITLTVTLPPVPTHAAGTTATATIDNVAAAHSREVPTVTTAKVTVHLEHERPPAPPITPVPPVAPLPATGTAMPVGAVWAGASLLVAGLVLAMRRRIARG